jgi:hypothetical protein
MKRGLPVMMKRGQPPAGYITATEAKLKLDIDDGMLYSYVQQKRIRRFVPPGRKQGFYLEADVDALAQVIRQTYGQLASEIHFQRSTDIKDLIECSEIARDVYGDEGTPVATRLKWIEKNPEILYLLKAEHVEGYCYILPLERETIDAVMRDEKSLKDVMESDIKRFASGDPLDIYLMSLVIKSGPDKLYKRLLSSQLIVGLMSVLRELARRGVVIRTLSARSRFPEGIRLLRDMGFSDYDVQSPNPEFSYFILDVEQSNAPFIRRYKRDLQRQRGDQASDAN